MPWESGPPPVSLDDARAIVRQYGNHAGRAWYAGAQVEPATGELVVHRVPHRDFDVHVLGLVPDTVPIRFVDAEHSLEELLQAREIVLEVADVADVVDVRVPHDGSRVVVDVRGPVAEVQREFDVALPGLTEVVGPA